MDGPANMIGPEPFAAGFALEVLARPGETHNQSLEGWHEVG